MNLGTILEITISLPCDMCNGHMARVFLTWHVYYRYYGHMARVFVTWHVYLSRGTCITGVMSTWHMYFSQVLWARDTCNGHVARVFDTWHNLFSFSVKSAKFPLMPVGLFWYKSFCECKWVLEFW